MFEFALKIIADANKQKFCIIAMCLESMAILNESENFQIEELK